MNKERIWVRKDKGGDWLNPKYWEKGAFTGTLKKIIYTCTDEKGNELKGVDDDAILKVGKFKFRAFLPASPAFHDDYVESINKKMKWVAFLTICHPEENKKYEKEVEGDLSSFRETVKGEVKEVFGFDGRQEWLLVDAGIPVFVENGTIWDAQEKRVLQAKQGWKKGDYLVAKGRLDLHLLREKKGLH